MKILKYVLYAIALVLAIYIILCALGPNNMDVVKTTSVNAPASIPFNLTKNLKKTEMWNTWTIGDTTLKVTYNDTSDGVDASSSWESALTGKGSQKIIESEKNKRVRSQLNFDGWDGDNFAEFQFNQQGNTTDISYSFEGTQLPFLFRGFALLTGMKKSMHTNYSESLELIKEISEERAKGIYSGYEIMEQDLEERHFVMNRQEVNRGDIQQFYTTNLGALFNTVQSAGVEMDGMPCGLFFNWPSGDEPIDMAAAIPIVEEVTIKGVKSFSIPAKRGLVLDYYGEYDSIGKGIAALEEYMNDRGYLLDLPMIEEYKTDPGQEPDPSKWLTKITRYYTPAE